MSSHAPRPQSRAGPWTIRPVQGYDRDALLELERISPDRGTISIGLDLRVPQVVLAARYPNSEG